MRIEIGEDLGGRTHDGLTLIHSFETLNVGRGDTVAFLEPQFLTRNIIARVTGGAPSAIYGQFQVFPDSLGPGAGVVEFFFVNPAGLVFGPGSNVLSATSFIATTADELEFSPAGSVQDVNISARAGNFPPVLSLSEVIALGFRDARGSITVDGAKISVVREGGLALIAGAPGTRIGISFEDASLPSLLQNSLVPLAPGTSAVSNRLPARTITGLSLLERGDDAPGTGGELIVRDTELTLAFRPERTFFPAEASAFLAGRSVSIENSSLLSGSVTQLLASGSIQLSASSLSTDPFSELSISGRSIDVRGTSFTAAGFSLDSASHLTVSNSTFFTQPAFAPDFSPIGGTIELAAPVIQIGEHSRLESSASSSTFAPAVIGSNIAIRGDRVRISGGSELTSQVALNSASMRFRITPRAGSISIDAGDIEILEGSSLNSSAALDPRFPALSDQGEVDPATQGVAGSVRVSASGTVRISDSRLQTQVEATAPAGPSGAIEVLGARIDIDRSSITSTSVGSDAGTVSVHGSGQVSLSEARVTTSSTAGGSAGSVLLSGGAVGLERTTILSSNDGSGAAGSVGVDATSLSLTASSIATNAKVGPVPGAPADGNIIIDVRRGLLLEEGSTINASVIEGQGGDVRIASSGSVVLRNGSQVLARTELGKGGRIDISATSFISDSSSRVSADASVGTSGTVGIRSPDVDLQGGLEDLSAEFLDVSALLRPSCEARETRGAPASLYVERVPGLPTSPEEWLLALELPARDVGVADGELAALLASARSQQAEGAYAESLATLARALSEADRTEDRSGIAAVLGASGNAQQALGQRAVAESLLMRGVRLAQQQGEVALASRIENDLGNYYAAEGAATQAHDSYAEAIARAERSGDALATVKALANAARLALESGDDSEARALLERADRGLVALPDGHSKASALIHLGRSHAQLAEKSTGEQAEASLLRAYSLLQSAAELSRDLDEPRLRAYALGNLGRLYQSERRFDEALALTREALRAAERAQATDALYRWHWQEGQLLRAQGKADPAVRAFRRAVGILEATRQESRAQYGARSFGRAFAPVYLDLADALLRGADTLQGGAVEALLLEARSTVEKLKAAELRSYLRDDCASQLEARTASLDSLASGAAVVYPIALRDRLELLVRLPDGLQRYTVQVPADRVELEAKRLRLLLQDRTSSAYRPVAERLYDWLVRPYAAGLGAKGVQTLVFVPAGVLRTVPMAALHDGERFLAERFGIAAAPGLSLVDPRPLDLARVKPLLGGVSEAVQEFEALDSVPREIASIHELLGGEVLLDEAFQTDRIEAAIRESRPTLVHFASHAVFTGDPRTSFVLTHDGRMTMGELAALLGRTRFRTDPVELLVLSACDTAVGDDRAELGLAGVAVRSGARSALGSLWAISDEATYPLIASFYASLREPGTSRAAALRHAQNELLASEKFSHPFYWSTFVLISNWL